MVADATAHKDFVPCAASPGSHSKGRHSISSAHSNKGPELMTGLDTSRHAFLIMRDPAASVKKNPALRPSPVGRLEVCGTLYRRAKMETVEEKRTRQPESTHAVYAHAAGEGCRDPGPRPGHPRGRRRRDPRTGRQPRFHRRRPPLRGERVHDPRDRAPDRRQGRRATPGGEKTATKAPQ